MRPGLGGGGEGRHPPVAESRAVLCWPRQGVPDRLPQAEGGAEEGGAGGDQTEAEGRAEENERGGEEGSRVPAGQGGQ